MVALGLALVLGGAISQGQILSDARPVSMLVIVSGNGIPKEKLSKLLALPTTFEVRSSLGKQQFRLTKQGAYEFLIDEAAFGLVGLGNRKTMLNAFSTSLRKGEATLSLDRLSPDEAMAIRTVVEEQAPFINEGMRHLIQNPALKVTLEPMVTAWFQNGDLRKRATAGVMQKSQDVLTVGGDTKESTANAELPGHSQSSVENALHFFFSNDFQKPSHRIKALLEAQKVIQEIQDTEIAAFTAAFAETRALLFEKYKDQLGGEVPPVAAEVSKLPRALQDSLARFATAFFSSLGFKTGADAENWIRGAKMSGANAYINFVIGGLDKKSGQITIGSLVLDRP